MKMNQGDILIDHYDMLKRIEENDEIEIYVDRLHFDSEIRFQYAGYTVDDARNEARKHRWGAYNILLKFDSLKDKIYVWIEPRENTDVKFPITEILNGTTTFDLVEYDVIDEYGERKTWKKEEKR